jgi:ATP-dependent protease HslVU (ClpYQ) peptidase subunit
MTALVGLRESDHVWIGADSALVEIASGDARIMSTSKVFRSGDYLIAVCGSLKSLQLIKHRIEYPPFPQKLSDAGPDEIEHFFVTQFTDPITDGIEKHVGAEAEEDFAIMVAVGKHLLTMSTNLQVEIVKDDYAALGSGMMYSMGSLYSTTGNAVERVRVALGAAAEYNATVAPPFCILRT